MACWPVRHIAAVIRREPGPDRRPTPPPIAHLGQASEYPVRGGIDPRHHDRSATLEDGSPTHPQQGNAHA
jgi:hypothetical protein